ncbi:MAG: type I methionyl aminopeptidase [bacterium]
MIISSRIDFLRLRAGGKKLGKILEQVASEAKQGVSTKALSDLADKLILEAGGEPAFIGYGQPPYPTALCTSVNDVVVHGIPSSARILNEGDIVGLDIGIRYDGFYTDAAVSVAVGKVSLEAERLLAVTKEALRRGLAEAKPNKRIGDIGAVVQQLVEKEGFNVVRDLSGHGVGLAVHEDPPVPNFGRPGTGLKLREGLVLAIEPMVNVGRHKVETAENQWDVLTADRSLSAHFEHTVLVTGKWPEPVVLTDPRAMEYDNGEWL